MKKITYKMFTGFNDPKNDYAYGEEYYKYWIILGYLVTLVTLTGMTFIIITALMSYFV